MADLHARIAKLLDWPVEDARSFSLLTLRDLAAPLSPELANEITRVVCSGEVLRG